MLGELETAERHGTDYAAICLNEIHGISCFIQCLSWKSKYQKKVRPDTRIRAIFADLDDILLFYPFIHACQNPLIRGFQSKIQHFTSGTSQFLAHISRKCRL